MKTFLTILTFLFTLSGIASAATSTCELLLSNLKEGSITWAQEAAPEDNADQSVKEFQRVWEKAQKKPKPDFPRFGETFSARHGNPDFEVTTNLRIAPDPQLLYTMLESITPLLDSDIVTKFKFTERDIKFFRSIQNEIVIQRGSTKVSYDDYINLAYYFSVAMVRKSQRSPGPKPGDYRVLVEVDDDLVDPALPKGKWWPHMKRLMEQTPRILLLPTFRNLSKNDFNKLRPYPIYYLGLMIEPDLKSEGPNQLLFFLHDVSHAASMADVDLSDRGIRVGGDSAISSLYRRIAFNKAFETELLKVPSMRLREVIQDAWFELFHEGRNMTFDNKSLHEGLSRHHPPEYLAMTSEALKGLSLERQRKIAVNAVEWLNAFSDGYGKHR